MKDTHVYNDKKYKGNLLSIKSPYKHLTQLEFLLEDIFQFYISNNQVVFLLNVVGLHMIMI